MNFWLRNGILGIILLGLAFGFYINKDFFFALSESSMEIEEVSDDSPEIETDKKESTNAAADNFSKYYANIHGTGSGPRIVNNVIYLEDPKGDLEQILQAKEKIARPYKRNWHGSTESRPFRKDETLYNKLKEYAAKDRLELIWWLNRDFIIKDPFRINKNILQTGYQVGKAVEGHFQNGINIYFCYKHRALVLIDGSKSYLEKQCILVQ